MVNPQAPKLGRRKGEEVELIERLAKAYKTGSRELDWEIFRRMSRADWDAVDRWLVEQKHPLAYEAMTQESRVRAIAKEMAGLNLT